MKRTAWVVACLCWGSCVFAGPDGFDEASVMRRIKLQLSQDQTTRARQIGVVSHDGVVTLTGTVNSAAERNRALSITRGTPGVKYVDDHLIVKGKTLEASATPASP